MWLIYLESFLTVARDTKFEAKLRNNISARKNLFFNVWEIRYLFTLKSKHKIAFRDDFCSDVVLFSSTLFWNNGFFIVNSLCLTVCNAYKRNKEPIL